MVTKLDDDENICYITGLDLTVDGNILLADKGNSMIKLFSPYGQFLAF